MIVNDLLFGKILGNVRFTKQSLKVPYVMSTHLDPPPGFGFSECLPEICYIFIGSLRKQSANQKRATGPPF